ncbi:MAG: 30S ribosomal protein S7 [Candidatus Nanoarchaeia archaeon]|nr:30S ribosomal protein S7 [Candidatus Nanoarchaeia archaeon]
MIKLFDKWDTSNISVADPGLRQYINLQPILVPRTFGRNSNIQFWKSKYHIVERLTNKLMNTGHRGKTHRMRSGNFTGKGLHVYNTVQKALEMVEKKLNKNPVEVLIKAIENAAPRDEITTIEYGGARYPQAVEMSPQRRVDFALRTITQGSYQKTFRKKMSIATGLAEEIISAYNLDNKSYAISKKFELERQADAAR